MHDYEGDTPDYNLTPEQRVALKRARAKFGMGIAIGALGGLTAVLGAFFGQPWLWGPGGLVALIAFGIRVAATIERHGVGLDSARDTLPPGESEGAAAPSPEESAAREPAKPVPGWLGVAVGAAVLAGLIWAGLGMFAEG